MWGFSGANAFEWSVLHELMAGWLDVPIGTASFIAGSFHLYEDHWHRANKIASKFRRITPYDFQVPSLPLNVSWGGLNEELHNWFKLEDGIRKDPFAEIKELDVIGSVFLRTSLELIRLYWVDKHQDRQTPDSFFAEKLSVLPECDLVAAAYEYFGRTRRVLLKKIPHLRIAEFFEDVSREKTAADDFVAAIKITHSSKDRAYGGAWKKRGELISVLPNIARKVDRLSVFVASKSELSGETVLDTAVDLLVYVIKYQLFLEDIHPESILPASAAMPFADHDENFNTLLDDQIAPSPAERRNSDLLIGEIEAMFERLWPIAECQGPIADRKSLSASLAALSAELVMTLRTTDPESAASFIASTSK